MDSWGFICPSRVFVESSRKPLYLTMLGEIFKVHGVQITRKCICESKKMNLFIFTHTPNQNSPPGFYHKHPNRGKLLI